mmetsp:Transcript_2483/g.7163  ORF Transcript_2483/g.7163 Transcript_2483/m.7163 type:complete len:313 (+) Transcript_2483:1304-2242(+)
MARLIIFGWLCAAAAAKKFHEQTREEMIQMLKNDKLAKAIRDETRAGTLPRPPGDLRHRWQRDRRSGSISRHQQHQFMWSFVDTYGSKLPPKPRCLDWEGSYLKTIFNATCAVKDYVIYAPSESQSAVRSADARFHTEYRCDAHTMANVIPHHTYDLVVANSVFEHMKQPFVVAEQISKVLKPGGYLLWHTPFMYPFHGVPADYFRYTHAGAAAVAESAGLVVDMAAPDGSYLAVVAQVLGFDSRYWSDAELGDAKPLPPHDDLEALHHKVVYHLSTKMVARKPLELTHKHEKLNARKEVRDQMAEAASIGI